MLEIIAVYFLCRKCSRTAKAKGYVGAWFGLLAAGLWFSLEIIGAVIGIILVGYSEMFVLYFFGLIGAGAGAAIALGVVHLLRQKPAAQLDAAASGSPGGGTPPVQPVMPQVKPYCLRCGCLIPEGGKFCVKCGTAVQ